VRMRRVVLCRAIRHRRPTPIGIQPTPILSTPPSRVEDERPLLDDYKTILVELSRIGRCDIVERILNNGPKSCNAYKEFATAIASWTRQPEPVVEPSFTMLDGALTEPNPMIRMTKLIDLAKLCYKARYH